MQPDIRSQGRFLPDWVVGRIGGGLNAFIYLMVWTRQAMLE